MTSIFLLIIKITLRTNLIFFLFFIKSDSIFSFIGYRFLEEDISAYSQSLGGSSVSFRNNTLGGLANTAHLANLKEKISSIIYDQDAVENKLLLLNFTRNYQDIPVSLHLGTTFANKFTELDDLGQVQVSENIYALLFSVGSAKKIHFFSNDFFIGAALKLVFEDLIYEKNFYPLLDFGLLFEKKFDFITIGKSRSEKNFSIGFTLINLGYPQQVLGINQSKPLQSNLGFRFLIFEDSYLTFNLLNEFSFFFFENREIEPKFAISLNFLKYLEMRSAIVYQRQQFDYRFGVGFFYNIRGLYRLGLNYALSPFLESGVSQNIDLFFSITFDGEKEKIINQISNKNILEDSIKSDVLALMENTLKLYYLDNNHYPDKISDLESYLKEKHGFTSLPQPASGYWHYDKHSGKIKIVDAPVNEEDEQEFFLQDGGRIRGIIIEEREDSYNILVNGKKINLMKTMIQSHFSIRLRKLDMEVMATLKIFLDEFVKSNGKFPGDLVEFEGFLKRKYSLINMPRLLTGKLNYDATNGTLNLENL